MKRFLVLGAFGVAFAACSESPRTESDLPSSPGVVAFAPGGPVEPTGCSFNNARTYARDYFATSALDKQATDLLKAAEDAGAGTRLRNDKFFDLFQLIESARTGGYVNAASYGANLILEANDCGSFIFTHGGSLLADLTESLTGGAFAYRNDSEGFVATADGGAALYTANWPVWIGGRSMVIGLRLSSLSFGEAPVGTFAYRFGVLYDGATTGYPATPGFSGPDDIATVELCELAETYESRARVGRVKGSGAQTILQQGNIVGFCDTLTSEGQPSGFFARALSEVVAFFVPTPLQARMFAPPGMAGGIGELSDFIGADAVSVNLSYLIQPSSGLSTQPFLVKAKAVGANGTPLENVALTLSISGNQGTPAGATLTANPLTACGLTDTGITPSLTVNTDEAGESTWCVNVNKAGGYTLAVTSSFDGFAPVTLGSDLFTRSP